MRIGFDRSITAFNAAGNARYALCLFDALQRSKSDDIELLLFDLPAGIRARQAHLGRKALTVFWEFIYAPLLLPMLARSKRVDLIHCPLPMPIGPTSCPKVMTILDVIPVLFPQWFKPAMQVRLRRWIRRGVTDADALITISHHTAGDVRRVFPRLTKPIYPIPLGSFLSERNNWSVIKVREPYILSVGTLEPRKNLKSVLKAYAILRREWPTTPKLVVVGGRGWGEDDLVSVSYEVGVTEKIEWRGFVSDQELGALYAGATLLVYPSLYEGFGFPVLEAMSVGCPVVTSNRSSLPEITGNAGLLVDPTDPQQIADAMYRILDDAGLAEHLRQAGRRRAGLFSWQRCAQETLAVYTRTFTGASHRNNED